jgi:hypothetical protein
MAMDALVITALCGALLMIIGFGALAIDRRQHRRRHTDSK